MHVGCRAGIMNFFLVALAVIDLPPFISLPVRQLSKYGKPLRETLTEHRDLRRRVEDHTDRP